MKLGSGRLVGFSIFMQLYVYCAARVQDLLLTATYAEAALLKSRLGKPSQYGTICNRREVYGIVLLRHALTRVLCDVCCAPACYVVPQAEHIVAALQNAVNAVNLADELMAQYSKSNVSNWLGSGGSDKWVIEHVTDMMPGLSHSAIVRMYRPCYWYLKG